MYFYLHPEIKNAFPSQVDSFSRIMSLHGEVYRELENRRTQRIQLNKTPCFIKQHFGIGWKEIGKNLLQLRLPAISAKNEWRAIQRLEKLGINTPEILGMGYRGNNPALIQSFIITKELPPFITLEDLGKKWQKESRPFQLKYQLIQEIARIARVLHQNGVNHRDFYLCHFLLDLIEYSHQTIKLYLIDLHRAQIRNQTPERWRIKDVAGLYFSSKDMGLTQRDLWRFMKYYRQQSLRDILNTETQFWLKVKKRGDKLYRDQHK